MGTLISKLVSAVTSGGPLMECADNRVQCCVTETISNSSSSSHGSRQTVVPERYTTDKYETDSRMVFSNINALTNK